VLRWLKQLLGVEQPANPYAIFNAAPLDVNDGRPLLLAELERTNHLIAVAPTLFNLNTSGESADTFLAAETLAFVRNLVAWMAGGGRLELALAPPPAFSPEFPASLALWYELRPRLADGSLKFWKLPRNFDARSWPRALTNPGHTGSVAWFTPAGVGAGFLDEPLPAPLWRGPGLTAESVAALRLGWEEQKVSATAKPSDLALHEYRAGEARDLKRDFGFCRGQSFALLRIEDPYVLASEWPYRGLLRFLDELAKLWEAWPVKVEIKTRDMGTSDQKMMIADLVKALKPRKTVVEVRRVVTSGPRRTDFHDRRLIFQPEAANPRRRVTVLLTGGVDRYLDQKFECGIITHSVL
jgi:hypothetical protein